MSLTLPDPLDETVSCRGEVITWWVEGSHGLPDPPFQPLEPRMIHRYFSESTFFDHTTKNGLLFEQSRVDGPLWWRVHNREEFEALLRSRPGQEYMIVSEPEMVKGVWSGVWVIRKQDRKAARGDEAKGIFTETETLGTWYLVGANMYQAPSVADVVGNGMLTVATNLSKFLEKAAALPSFAPTTGHTYLPATNKATTTAAGSTAGSPARSREGSVALGMDTQSIRSTSPGPPGSHIGSASSTAASVQASRLLAQSLQMSLQFGDEYMDENPILGEPGRLKFTSSTAAVKKRKLDEAAAAAKAAVVVTAAKPVEKAPSPPAVFSEAKSGGGKIEKEKREGKKRRRKSRPNANANAVGVAVG